MTNYETMKEFFVKIPGFDGYEISNLGNVKSLERYIKIQDRTKFVKERILRKAIGKRGYYVVLLKNKNKAYTKYIHRLIAETFIHNFYDKKLINHKDGNKLNNSIDNLEWCTPKENLYHAVKTGLRNPFYMKGKLGEKSNSKKIIYQYDLEGNFIKEWNGAREVCRELNFKSPGKINYCCRGKQKSSKGFIWKYKEGDYEKTN